MTQSTETPRGIRNNNPGNIRRSSIVWQGMAANQNDPEFVMFIAAVWGIRAIAKILLNYRANRGLTTIRQLINRWAPPEENDTDAYIDHVAIQCGISADADCDVRDMAIASAVVAAIISHENGEQPYDRLTIQKGLSLAGITRSAAA